MSDKKRIFTCTPRSFSANERFWIRDTGLVCRHLQMLGIESKCIMPLPWHGDEVDTEHVVRASLRELGSASWWRSLHLDGLVLYSWGLPEFIPVARAVRSAGIPMSIHWDGGGDLLPSTDMPFFKKVLVRSKFYIMDYLRAKHLSYACFVTMAPTVCGFFMKRRVWQRIRLSHKCVESPCPVSCDFRYEGKKKEPLMIAIGRWNDEEQKRTRFLMQTLEHCYKDGCCEAATEIYGTITPELQAWYDSLPENIRKHISLMGYLNNAMLKEVYNRARIIFCTSSHESSHIVSAEALCCGCSVVVTNLPKTLSVLHWYTSHQSGCISEEDTPVSLAEALSSENRAWENGERNPEEIASYWQPHFHADKVYAGIFKLK